MTPEISEFSYGFALTNELVGWTKLRAAPIFPSLIEEGRAGGGYDVHLKTPGIPLYLQFKRADCMIRNSAKEIQEKLFYGPPFYRFSITNSKKSDQHNMLLELDDSNNLVLYAAPRFYSIAQINKIWYQKKISSRSIFIRPKEIGVLPPGDHKISYNRQRAWLCSEPKNISFLNSTDVRALLDDRLAQEKRPLEETIHEIVPRLLSARERGLRRRSKEILAEEESDVDFGVTGYAWTSADFSSRDPRKALREIADISSRDFSAQVFIIQED